MSPSLAISNVKSDPPPEPSCASVIVIVSPTACPVPPFINSIKLSPGSKTLSIVNVIVSEFALPKRLPYIVKVSPSEKSIPPSNISTLTEPELIATLNIASSPEPDVAMFPAVGTSNMSTTNDVSEIDALLSVIFPTSCMP